MINVLVHVFKAFSLYKIGIRLYNYDATNNVSFVMEQCSIHATISFWGVSFSNIQFTSGRNTLFIDTSPRHCLGHWVHCTLPIALSCIIVTLRLNERKRHTKRDETKYGLPFPVKCAIIKYGRKYYVIIWGILAHCIELKYKKEMKLTKILAERETLCGQFIEHNFAQQT